jgi:phosphopantothenoylcysteine decarboxylase / phosphopantothenate---cysteine ligase
MRVETAREMLEAVERALPADAAVFAAAVADWRVEGASDGRSRRTGRAGRRCWPSPRTPTSSRPWPGGEGRPRLVVGFAAETHDVVAHARAKRARKGCDWIVANDVSPGTGIMGGTENAVTLVTAEGEEAGRAWARTRSPGGSRRGSRRRSA